MITIRVSPSPSGGRAKSLCPITKADLCRPLCNRFREMWRVSKDDRNNSPASSSPLVRYNNMWDILIDGDFGGVSTPKVSQRSRLQMWFAVTYKIYVILSHSWRRATRRVTAAVDDNNQSYFRVQPRLSAVRGWIFCWRWLIWSITFSVVAHNNKLLVFLAVPSLQIAIIIKFIQSTWINEKTVSHYTSTPAVGAHAFSLYICIYFIVLQQNGGILRFYRLSNTLLYYSNRVSLIQSPRSAGLLRSSLVWSGQAWSDVIRWRYCPIFFTTFFRTVRTKLQTCASILVPIGTQ